MKDLFSRMDEAEFIRSFDKESSCLRYLAFRKWGSGFRCRKCGHNNYCRGRRPYSRRCTRCKSEESATAHTIFHRCRVPLPHAFLLARTICMDPDISSYKLSKKLSIRHMTCWKLKKKLTECMKTRGDLDVMQDKNSF